MSDLITLAHGAGGKQTAELIDRVFKAHFSNPQFTGDDAAVLPIGGTNLAFTTDGFIVSPPEFPGGNIGKLSICGTVNDLSCMGAKPLYLSCAFVIEEGFPMEKVEAYAKAMAETAAEAGVRIVAGDTKVAGKGQVDHLFITTTGIGQIMDGVQTSGTLAKPGDAIIVSGDVGRHGCTILLERNQFGIDADVTSDCAPLWGTVESSSIRLRTSTSSAMQPAAVSAPSSMKSRRRARSASIWTARLSLSIPPFAASAACWALNPYTWPAKAVWSSLPRRKSPAISSPS